jgi:hypothetical protein
MTATGAIALTGWRSNVAILSLMIALAAVVVAPIIFSATG